MYSKMATINDYLPMEMLMEIFEKIDLHCLVVSCSKTCMQWKENIVQHILGPNVLKLASVNEKFKRNIEKNGWSEDETDTELILSLYPSYEFHSSKYTLLLVVVPLEINNFSFDLRDQSVDYVRRYSNRNFSL